MGYKYKAMCDWETSGIKKAQSNAVQYRFDNMRGQRDEDLQGRRARLAEMIAREDQIYEAELASLTKTADERKRDMQQRAEALKANREEKHKAQAMQLNYVGGGMGRMSCELRFSRASHWS